MTTFGPRGNVKWGAILQEPNLYSDTGTVGRRASAWTDRRNTLDAAQQTALASLNAALTAQRDKQMADLAAADALKASRAGGSGGGRSGGSGAGSAPAYTIPPPVDSSWLDQLGTYQVAPPPGFDAHLFPSTAYTPAAVYANPKPHSQVKGVGNKGRGGFRLPTKLAPTPTKYNVRLS